ncbi:polyprenyl synthetase family protein, partial [bacterium]|nr:polyprenyl synthetase family protein [bacterium]
AMLEERSLPLLDILATTSKRMSRGQLLELTRTRRGDISEASYFDTIADKTAALMRACCQLGALSLGENDDVQLALAEYGESVGIAFQIRDDLLDYTGRTRVLGKRVGGDIRDKKITLPFIAAYQRAGEGKGKEMLTLLRRGAKGKDVSLIVQFVRTSGGVDYAREQAIQYGQRAEKALSPFPDSESKSILIQFIQYAIHREK